MTDRIQDVEDIFIGAECEFDPKGHWIKVDDSHKLYKALLAWHDKEIAEAKKDAWVDGYNHGFVNSMDYPVKADTRGNPNESNKEGAGNE